MEISTI